MGRSVKMVFADDLDRREIGYYSTPPFVADFLSHRMLELRPGAHFVFDPCVGRGELTKPLKLRGCHVSGCDLIDMSPQGVDNFVQSDFLQIAMEHDPSSLFGSSPKQKPDIIVANPPYNCHEVDYIRTHKSQLIARFGKAAVLNMYALFVRAIIDYAPDGCLIGLVTHDSFLTASGHEELRRYILSNCIIHNLHLCPTDLFLSQGADVRTCLLVLEKSRRSTDKIRVSNRPSSSAEFDRILLDRSFDQIAIQQLLLSDPRDNAEFTVGVPSEITALFRERRLADIAPCVTGISTGEDKKYIRTERSSDFAVPFYKNPASRRFFAEPDGFLCTDYAEVAASVSNFMVRNRELIFRGGISCSSMGVKFGGTIRPAGSACGVNPNVIIEDERKWWLLSFLNSRLCLYLTKGVIIRGNMITAGYASRVPVPHFSMSSTQRLSELGFAGFEAAKSKKPIAEIKAEIDRTIEAELDLSTDTVDLLRRFELDPTRLA